MRTTVKGTDVHDVCQEVVDRGLHPENVDVDLGDGRVLPLVLDDPAHFTLYVRLYSRALAARNLFLSGNIRRTLWEIGAALIAADEPPCFLEGVYLAEIRLALANAEEALRTGQTSALHHGPYASMTIAENLCLMRLFRRQLHPVFGAGL
ncbi:hypothetical protein R8Z50_06780 [Longispora sp. K20-0274]|uniref:hypothetical protein n=1 Tax=Longispora sp. K20-0274 TaxID=3088255 RepID=UPI003999CA1F